MNVIVCDSCGLQTDRPHSVGMKEFCIGLYANGDRAMFKKKVKIHLCERCFSRLSTLAEERGTKK